MPYRHKIIQGLAELINEYGGKGNDPIMKAVWWGIKGQVPSLLQTLDENEEAIAEIRAKLFEVLDIVIPDPVVKEAKAVGEAEAPKEKEAEVKSKKKERKGKG